MSSQPPITTGTDSHAAVVTAETIISDNVSYIAHLPGEVFQRLRSGVSPLPTLATSHLFLQLVLLLCTLTMQTSLELEWSSLSEMVPRSLQSHQE